MSTVPSWSQTPFACCSKISVFFAVQKAKVPMLNPLCTTIHKPNKTLMFLTCYQTDLSFHDLASRHREHPIHTPRLTSHLPTFCLSKFIGYLF